MLVYVPLLKTFQICFPVCLFCRPMKTALDFSLRVIWVLLYGKCSCYGWISFLRSGLENMQRCKGQPFKAAPTPEWIVYLGFMHCVDSQVGGSILSLSWLNSFKVNSITCLHVFICVTVLPTPTCHMASTNNFIRWDVTSTYNRGLFLTNSDRTEISVKFCI